MLNLNTGSINKMRHKRFALRFICRVNTYHLVPPSSLAHALADLILTVTNNNFQKNFKIDMFKREYFDLCLLIDSLSLEFSKVYFPKITTPNGQVSVIKFYYCFFVKLLQSCFTSERIAFLCYHLLSQNLGECFP